MEAYQTTLLPDRPKDEISRLNCLDFEDLRRERINVKREIARAMAVSEPVFHAERIRVHYAGELLEVMLSLRRFNTDFAEGAGTTGWGQRVFRFFVFDPTSGQFAPSKFCAYLPFTNDSTLTPSDVLASREMTVALYTRIEASAKRFDGNKAWKHLTRQLGMTMYSADELPELRGRFDNWLAPHASLIAVHPDGPEFLTPPPWFA